MGDSDDDVRYRKNPLDRVGCLKNSSSSSGFQYSSSAISSSLSVSDEEPESNTTESTSDIFYIYKPDPTPVYDVKIGSPIPGTYQKHAALDTEQLTVRQRIRLVALHYLRLSNILRTLFVIGCFAWFLFNVITVFNEFLRFDTIVYMEYRSPNATNPPAITICTFCIYCGYDQKEPMLVAPLLQNTSSWSHSRKEHLNPNLTKYNLNVEDIVKECRLFSSTVPQDKNKTSLLCDQVAPVVVSMQEGQKCFTYFSDIYGGVNQSTAKGFQMEFERFPNIRLQFYGKNLNTKPSWNKDEDELNNPNEQIGSEERTMGIYFVIHSPGILPDMLGLTFHRVVSKKKDIIRFTKMIEDLKEPPYQTMCFPYPIWQSKSPIELDQHVLESTEYLQPTGNHPLSIYRSQGECFLYCMWRRLAHGNPHNPNQCVNFYNVFTENLLQYEQWQRESWKWNELKRQFHKNHPSNETLPYGNFEPVRFCNQTSEGYNDYTGERKECLKRCHSACHQETYSIGALIDGSTDNTDDAIYELEWSTEPVIYIEHREKFTLPGFLGNIGGHAHIWLGISVIHIFRWLVKVIRSGRLVRRGECCWIFSWFHNNQSK